EYGKVMEAYIAGLEDRRKARKPIGNVASVASFFLSRIDVLVDKLLGNRVHQKAHALIGQVALASARMAYNDYEKTFSGKRWSNLKRAGARVQRPLWASTS